MQVILLQKVGHLGDIGAQVNVRPGYGRNYLFPQGIAVPATSSNLADLERRRAELEQRAAERLAVAQSRAEALQSLTITIPMKVGEGGKLFGSVGTRDIVDAAKRLGHEITKSEIRLPQGVLREIGEHPTDLELHSDVVVTVKINIVPL